MKDWDLDEIVDCCHIFVHTFIRNVTDQKKNNCFR